MTAALSHRVTYAIRDGANTVPALQAAFPNEPTHAIYSAVSYAIERRWVNAIRPGLYEFASAPKIRKTTRPGRPVAQPAARTAHLQEVWRC